MQQKAINSMPMVGVTRSAMARYATKPRAGTTLVRTMKNIRQSVATLWTGGLLDVRKDTIYSLLLPSRRYNAERLMPKALAASLALPWCLSKACWINQVSACSKVMSSIG